VLDDPGSFSVAEYCGDLDAGAVRPWALVQTADEDGAAWISEALKVDSIHTSEHSDGRRHLVRAEGRDGEAIDAFLLRVSDIVDHGSEECGQPAAIIDTGLIAASSYKASGPLMLTPDVLITSSKCSDAPTVRHHLILTAGNVFGTGGHPSTRLAALALEDCFATTAMPPGRVLDVGCGSGILALLAAKLGAGEVAGVDISGEAVRQANENAAVNGLAGRVHFSQTPLAGISDQKDLLVANVTPSVLQVLGADIIRLLGNGGQLILAGFQKGQAPELYDFFKEHGFVLIKEYAQDVWRAQWFTRQV